MASKQAAPKESREAREANNRPQEIRLGRLKAAIWANPTDNGTRYNVKFARIYKDNDGNWSSSDSFGRDDLLLLATLAQKVCVTLFEQGSSSTENASENGRNAGDDDVPY